MDVIDEPDEVEALFRAERSSLATIAADLRDPDGSPVTIAE